MKRKIKRGKFHFSDIAEGVAGEEIVGEVKFAWGSIAFVLAGVSVMGVLAAFAKADR